MFVMMLISYRKETPSYYIAVLKNDRIDILINSDKKT